MIVDYCENDLLQSLIQSITQNQMDNMTSLCIDGMNGGFQLPHRRFNLDRNNCFFLSSC